MILVIVGKIIIFNIIIFVIKLKFIFLNELCNSGIKIVIFNNLYIIEGILINNFRIGFNILFLNFGEIKFMNIVRVIVIGVLIIIVFNEIIVEFIMKIKVLKDFCLVFGFYFVDVNILVNEILFCVKDWIFFL